MKNNLTKRKVGIIIKHKENKIFSELKKLAPEFYGALLQQAENHLRVIKAKEEVNQVKHE